MLLKKKIKARSQPIYLVLFLFLISFSASAQVGEFFKGNILNNFPWKWMLSQEWDSLMNTWGDTSTIVYTKGSSTLPSEILTRSKNSSGSWSDLQKIILTYENGKIKTGKIYIFLVDSLKYSTNPMAILNYTWEGELLSSVAGEFPLTSLADFEPETFGVFSPIFAEIKVLCELKNTIQNGKIVSGIMKEKLSIPPLLYAVFATFISTYESELPINSTLLSDTNWTNLIKTQYTYDGNSEIQEQFTWSTIRANWIPNGKDSIPFSGAMKPLVFHFDYDSTTQQLRLSAKDSTIYLNTGNPHQTIRMNWIGSSWQNESRSLYFYTDYAGSAVRYVSPNSTNLKIIASKISTIGRSILDLELNSSAHLSISINDLNGRTICSIPNCIFSAGTHSIQFPVYSQGKYLCTIRSEDAKTIIPFTIIK